MPISVNYRNNYVSEDLAILIPTKDRPFELKRLLQSIVEFEKRLGRIIVIASGMDVEDLVMTFMEFLPIEYYRSEPGQVQQRNIGISVLDHTTKLVATLDDDVVFEKKSISEMINYWNCVGQDTAGVGFNIVNQPPHSHTWLKGLFGVSVFEPGKVLKCGRNTSICNVNQNIKTEWLNGGGTVWLQSILQENPHTEINSRWAVFEDLIFSYQIGKNYSLYVCHESQIEIDDNTKEKESISMNFYRGKTQFLWKLYFINKNLNLSSILHYYSELIHLIHHLFKGISDYNKFFWGLGIAYGMFLSLRLYLSKKTLTNLIEENT